MLTLGTTLGFRISHSAPTSDLKLGLPRAVLGATGSSSATIISVSSSRRVYRATCTVVDDYMKTHTVDCYGMMSRWRNEGAIWSDLAVEAEHPHRLRYFSVGHIRKLSTETYFWTFWTLRSTPVTTSSGVTCHNKILVCSRKNSFQPQFYTVLGVRMSYAVCSVFSFRASLFVGHWYYSMRYFDTCVLEQVDKMKNTYIDEYLVQPASSIPKEKGAGTLNPNLRV